MTELILLAAITVYAFALGQRVIGFIRVDFISRAGWFTAATALGLGLLAYLVFLIGQFKCLHVEVILTICLVTLGVVYLPWRFICNERGVKGAVSKQRAQQYGQSLETWRARSFQFGVVTVALAGTLIRGLAPPTAGDALCYHLEIPKRFVQLGEVCYLPLTDNSLFPFLMEMLYTLGLLLSGPVLAQLLHWLVGVLFALAVVELATPILGARASAWAAVLALLVPGITNQMTAPLNDLAVALFSTLMVIAWTRWNDTMQRRWLVLAGVFGGFGLSVKLVTAAMVIVLLTATALQEWKRRGFGASWRAVATMAVCLVLCGGVWYVRSWYYLGNPIYPYFNGFFGLEPHTHSTLIATRNAFTLPWMATMHPEIFGGRGVQFGAVFLAVLPGLAILPQRAPALTRILVIALGHSLLWFALRQDLRFLLPVVPMLAIASVAAVLALSHYHRPAYLIASGCVAGLLLFQTLIVVKRARPAVTVALGRESREEYLRRHEPSYAVAEFVNTKLPPDCRVISQDFRGFYIEPSFVREAALRRCMPYEVRGDDLVQWLAAADFTHVLLVEAHNPETAVYDQGFAERLGPAIDRLPLVLATHFEGPSGDRRDYRLLALPPASVRSVERVAKPAARALKESAN